MNFFKNFFKKKAKPTADVSHDMYDCSVPPPVILCPKCEFGYAFGEHSEEQCLAAIESMKNACSKCNHPNHSDDMCFQAIAGYGGNLPSFCTCGRDEWMAKIKAKHEADKVSE
jgi:hypothetical protein